MKFARIAASSLVLAAVAASTGGEAMAQARHSAAATGVPPGLAKKGGMPPGQAKKYAVGRRLHRDSGYVEVRRPDRYRLPPLSRGEIYVELDGEILRVAETSLLVIAAVGAVADLLD